MKKSEDTVFYSEVKAKTLEEIFDKINNMNVPDVRVKEEDSMI